MTVDIDGRSITAATTHGAAVIDVDALESDTTYCAVLSDGNGRSLGELSVKTLPSIGPIISRFATISDVHLGATRFGPARQIRDTGEVPFTARCAKAALAAATAWGAEILLVKGDLTDKGTHDDWQLAKELFAEITIPYIVTFGNHDVWKTRDLDPAIGAQLLGLDHASVQLHDLAGIRLLLADTSIPDRGVGDLAQLTDELRRSTDTSLPVFLGIHHNIQRAPVTWFWPPGIPSTNATPAVGALSEANQNLFISSGHTHRNRAHWLGPGRSVPFTEVSATSDYPGAWAAYEVSETHVRQTVRRIAAAEAVDWTELTRAAIFGVWPRWSQGRLHDRCVDLVLR